MAEEQQLNEDQVSEQAAPDTPPAQEETGTDWKAEARKWEERAKANTAKVKDLQTKVSALDGSKSELDKALERIGKLEQANADLERAKITAEIAAVKQVDASLLTGSTREEIEAFADRLIAWRGGQPKQAAAPALGYQPSNDPRTSAAHQVVRGLFNKE